MRKLVEFGEPETSDCIVPTLSDIEGELADLIGREAERMEKSGATIYGKGRLARRIEIVEQACQLVQQAQNV